VEITVVDVLNHTPGRLEVRHGLLVLEAHPAVLAEEKFQGGLSPDVLQPDGRVLGYEQPGLDALQVRVEERESCPALQGGHHGVEGPGGG